MSDRWQFLASYTLAFAKIDAEGLPADQFNRAADYGYATADRRHRAVLSGIVDVYRGIQVSGIVQYQSSLPLDVTAGRDLNLDGLANDRPGDIGINDGCRGVDLGIVNAYRAANGAASVDGITCGDFLTVNTQVSRTFRLRGEHRIGIIFQVFNLLNRANRLPAVGNALSPLFGQALQVANARQGEVAIRYDF
jgi:outer membrane receptor for Fe3+-dicitrate